MSIDKLIIINKVNLDILTHMIHIPVFFESVLIYHDRHIMLFYKFIRKKCDNSLSSAKIKYLGAPNTYFHLSFSPVMTFWYLYPIAIP